ncbi:hypothetical protein G4228_014105 [Cervus hanglu yarkandensis]|nr:hypothetical protein G4228_014105 [Cervus hanglu yarkandensis]
MAKLTAPRVLTQPQVLTVGCPLPAARQSPGRDSSQVLAPWGLLMPWALPPAQALHCHVCHSSSNCKKPQICSASSGFCKTVIRVEPLSGNLVEKNCSVWCTPTNSQQGQVSKGQETTLCCKSDLCNEGLQSPQSAAPARTSAPLGLALVCGLLVLLWAPGL